jgi:outer membrane lipoprotein-sorting protein
MQSTMGKRLFHIALLLPGLLFTNACLFRSHKVERQVSSATLQTASQQQLVERVNSEAAKIKTMNAQVNIAASVGGAKKGKVTDYQEISGFILAEKPKMLRMIGLFPIVRNRAFDMVSDGEQFKLSVPPKGKFIVGRNDVIKPSPSQPLENLRPQHIYDALLLREIDGKNEVAVIEGGTETVVDQKTKKLAFQNNYVLNVIRRGGNEQGETPGQWYLSRKIFFNRVELKPYKQIVYDKHGNIATIADYSAFQDYTGVNFPSEINIERPQEEYMIRLKFTKLTLNEPLKAEQFQLQQPPGSQLVRLDENTATTQAADGK